jgi:hypothetical protein
MLFFADVTQLLLVETHSYYQQYLEKLEDGTSPLYVKKWETIFTVRIKITRKKLKIAYTFSNLMLQYETLCSLLIKQS